MLIDFNPRSPWGERPSFHASILANVLISIHAPRGGSDPLPGLLLRDPEIFQSTLPVGGATRKRCAPAGARLFQSTLPVGGATVKIPLVLGHLQLFQSTLPVGGATYPLHFFRRFGHHFNPRSPWGERLRQTASAPSISRFQSTLPVGGATPNDN